MTVITSGVMPPNPAELLGSEKMLDILDHLKESADVVVIDSPPTVVADAQTLASKVDGIVVVIHPGHTRLGAALAAVEQFRRVGGNVVGVVFNRISTDNRHYYGGYYYYTYNYYTSESEVKPVGILSWLKDKFKSRKAAKPEAANVVTTGKHSAPLIMEENSVAVESLSKSMPEPKKSPNGNGNGNGHANLKLGATLGSEHQFRIHKVDAGEKLLNIARAEGSSVSAISAVNHNFATPIKSEQLIVVPVNQTDASKLPSFEAYETKDEIEVEKLAASLNVDAAKLKYYNGLKDGYMLVQGDWIVVPKTKVVAG